jgi:hypothetical protein
MLNYREVSNSYILKNSVVWIGSRSHPSADNNWEKQLGPDFNEINKITRGSVLKWNGT